VSTRLSASVSRTFGIANRTVPAGPEVSGYQLLDTGSGAKLEQVGPYRLVRPAPQALWRPSYPSEVWDTAVARYHRQSAGGGTWTYKSKLPPTWVVTYCALTLKVRLTDFGHLGFFAEHGPHWQWLHQYVQDARRPIRLLNAFAYTGGISLAAAAAGASVVHLDAAEGMVTWARDNAQLSGLAEARIRWVVEDVTKFLTREVRRGNKYDAIVLDPPSFGRGSKGEVWKLERDLPAILDLCSQMLSDEPLCVLLSAHTPGVTPVVLAHLLADMLGNHRGLLTSMEMVIPHSDGTRVLPSGALARWSRD
jgi:23S rRNA (cytosine1962-C5)-methyltransferase